MPIPFDSGARRSRPSVDSASLTLHAARTGPRTMKWFPEKPVRIHAAPPSGRARAREALKMLIG